MNAGVRHFVKQALVVCAAMFLFGFACVPLYRIVCVHVLGIKVDDQAADKSKVALLQADTSRWVTVQFVGTVNSALKWQFAPETVRDRKSTRLNSSHITPSRMPSSA